MEDNKKVLDQMKEDIKNADIPEAEKSKLMKSFLKHQFPSFEK